MEKTIDIIVILWNTGIISAIAIWGIRLLQAHTKNQRLKVLAKYAGQAVANIKDPDNVTDEETQEAVTKLSILAANSGLKLKLPDDQAQDLIKGSIAALRAALKA